MSIVGTYNNPIDAGFSELAIVGTYGDLTAASTSDLPSGAGAAAGDLVVMSYRLAAGTPIIDIPGWTFVAEIGGSVRSSFFYRVFDGGSEDTIPYMGITACRRLVIVMRPNGVINGVTHGGYQEQSTDGNPSPQINNASSQLAPVVTVAYYAQNNGQTVDPRIMTPAKDAEIDSKFSGNSALWLAVKIQNSSPVDVTVDMDDEGSAMQLVSFWVKPS